MTHHYTCAQLLAEAYTLLVRISENDPGWQDDAAKWGDKYDNWMAEQSLGESSD